MSLPDTPHHTTDEFAVAVIKDSQIVGRTLLENLFIDHMMHQMNFHPKSVQLDHFYQTIFSVTDHVVVYYTKGLCGRLSSFCCVTGRRREGKGL